MSAPFEGKVDRQAVHKDTVSARTDLVQLVAGWKLELFDVTLQLGDSYRVCTIYAISSLEFGHWKRPKAHFHSKPPISLLASRHRCQAAKC